ncbi:condensation domain-containing protein [Streptomyces sp. NPDC088251]|uniref:condensation domain-containing protein n=1 Tax=unclassified Streptomyces TaxID=2593676 RepID=UPI0037F681DC
MDIERSGPVTNGQLSVLRSLEGYGATGQRVANLVSLWEVPAGASTARVMDAWGQLVAAHESLRTTYEFEYGRPVQVVHPSDPAALTVLDVTDSASGTGEATVRLAATWAAEPIDIIAGPPWRAFVTTDRGVPRHLVTVIHHVAADNGALQVLGQQFRRLIAGEVLERQHQPLDLALDQHGDPGLKEAVTHWAERWGSFSPEDRFTGDVSVRRRATLYSVEGLKAAQHVSRRTSVSVQAVLLALGALCLSRIKGRDRITFGLMTANRLDEQRSSLISSLNQCVPLSVRIDEDTAPDDFLRGIYGESLNAYLYGCFDVDALVSEVNRAGHQENDPTFFSSHFNFLGKGDGEPPEDSSMRTAVAWRESTQRTGPNFHLAIAVEKGLFIGVGASVDFLPGDLPAHLAASIESGLLTLAEEPPESLRELRCSPRRDIGGTLVPALRI